MKKASLTKVRTVFGVTEYRLTNGLRLLYKRVTSAPTVAVCVTFHVGSRNEAKGHTGATHILEHLLFKDSKNFNRKNGKAITDYLEWFGAYINATTWLDRTNYFELLPRERVGDALALEADRMRNSLFDDHDLKSEMTVVRNEFERSRNNPSELLDEEMMAEAFTKHPYRIPTIGLKEDIEHATAKKLREFYDTFYWPNNATLAVFGDVSWKEVENLILKEFGNIPSSPKPIPPMHVVEPQQERPRKVELKRPLGISLASLLYKIPEATHKDFPAVLMLGTILAGGFSSRMQKTIVDQGLAAGVSVMVLPLRDPSVMTFAAQVAHGSKSGDVLSAIRRECKKVASKGVTKREVVGAHERILSELAFERDGVFNDIRVVSEAIAAGDWTLNYRLPERIKKITPADIMRVARKYLLPKGETSGVLNEK